MLWTAEDDRKLLMAIIDATEIKPTWKVIGDAMGERFSAQAARQRFAKLKKEAKNTDVADEKSVDTPLPMARRRKRLPTPGSDDTKGKDSTKTEEHLRGRKRQRSAQSDDSEIEEPFRPRKLFVPAKPISGSKVSSPKVAFKEISVPKKVSKLPKKATDDNDE